MRPQRARRGQWWKSLLVSWLTLSAVGAGAAAGDVHLPEESGFPALIVLWLVVWLIWRRTARDESPPKAGVLGATRRTVAAFAIAVVLIGVVVLTLDTTAAVKRTGVPAEPVVLGVVVLAILSLVGGRMWVPHLDGSDRDSLVRTYRNRFFSRLAWAEWPALLAFGGFLLLGGDAWVFGIGLTASLAGFALSAPTHASLQRDQQQLDRAGSDVDLLDALGSGDCG